MIEISLFVKLLVGLQLQSIAQQSKIEILVNIVFMFPF